MTPGAGSRGFPLGRWVETHSAVRHNLAISGMSGALRTVPRILRQPPVAQPEQLAALLAEIHGVDPTNLFLTHGAHEANFLAVAFVSGRSRTRTRRLAVRIDAPEYPPFIDIVRATGNRVVGEQHPADVWMLSNPNNPTGLLRMPNEIVRDRKAAPLVIVDEAYREFTRAPSASSAGSGGLWVTGTFTKVYGADEIRVGWSIPPPELRAAYARFHPIASDKIAERSVRSAVAILRARVEVLKEVRGIFSRNAKTLVQGVPGAPRCSAPVWFDRGRTGLPGDTLQAAALRRSVLVSSGRFFGDPRGVRVCLTRPSFPADLLQYLKVRDRYLAG
jgi:histidinol-phosphate/aromatic aminotransferase/cobyric acid decarboxylase-like protein